MSILSSLLGITKGQPTQTIPTGVQTQEIAKEVAPFIKDILGKGQALYKQRTEEGFVPFEGKTLADVTTEQQQAQEGIRGLVGTQAPSFEEARGLVRGTTAKPTVEGLQEFMSPYQQAVIDVEKRRAQEAFERDTLPKVRQAQIASGAFGGTRGTLLEALALQDQARLLSDIEARGQQQAFESAQRAFEAQKQREAQAAQGLSGLAQTQFGQATRELGQLEAVGREQQQREQQLLDESYQRFLRERAFPEQQLAQYQGIVTGASPLIGTSTVQRTPQQFQPSPLASALGTAAQVADIYGTFSRANQPNLFLSPTKEGGQVVPAEGGGGLSILIKMIRAQKGKGGDPRSKRSKEIRTKIQQEDVTDMLEAFEKSGLPTIKKQQGKQVYQDDFINIEDDNTGLLSGDTRANRLVKMLLENLGEGTKKIGRAAKSIPANIYQMATDVTNPTVEFLSGLGRDEEISLPDKTIFTEGSLKQSLKNQSPVVVSDMSKENTEAMNDLSNSMISSAAASELNTGGIKENLTSTGKIDELIGKQQGELSTAEDKLTEMIGKIGTPTESEKKLENLQMANLTALSKEAAQDKLSAALRGFAKGALSPKIGRGGFVADFQSGLLESQKELSKLKGADAKVRAAGINLFKDKVNKEAKDEVTKLNLQLKKGTISIEKYKAAIEGLKAKNSAALLGIQLSGNKDTELKNAVALLESGFYSENPTEGIKFIDGLTFQSAEVRQMLKNNYGLSKQKPSDNKDDKNTNLKDADKIKLTR
jgi:hypothetical protein